MLNRIGIRIIERSAQQRIQLGREIITQVRSQFPDALSITGIAIRMGNIESPRLMGRINQLMGSFKVLRQGLKKEFPTFQAFIDELKRLISIHKIANCGEYASLTQYELLKKGEEAAVCTFEIQPKLGHEPFKNRIVSDHGFVIIGHNPNADLSNPFTWGKDTVIVDPWAEIAGNPHSVLERIKRFFQFNPQHEKLKFSEFKLSN